MLRFRPSHMARPTPLVQAAGRLVLVASGLAALAAVGLVASLMARPAPVPVAAHPPQIWLASLAPQPVSPLVDDLPATLVPRRTAPRPTGESPVAQPAPMAPPRPAPDPAPNRATAALAEGPVAAPTAAVPDPAALHRAPTRSPLPRPRPEGASEPPAVAALGQPGLLVSLLPARRPETVTRLASLDLADPGPATQPAAPSALAEAILGDETCGSVPTRTIPRRANGMAAGSDVISRLEGAQGRSRDDALVTELLAGNLPPFLRTLVPVTLTSGRTRVTLCVMPDYLAVGSDQDFVRVPMGLPAAMRVAERFDMVLPTTRMVDAIHAQASVRLSPSPMQPGPQMESTGYFRRHNATVESQRQSAGARLGQLVSGHKKDLVLTNRLNANPGRVAIYGWHRANGAPIQPLSTVHGASYADYSHGIRLISRIAYVNGRAIDLRDLLADSRLAGVVSAEGTITHRQLLAALE